MRKAQCWALLACISIVRQNTVTETLGAHWLHYCDGSPRQQRSSLVQDTRVSLVLQFGPKQAHHLLAVTLQGGPTWFVDRLSHQQKMQLQKPHLEIR
jgi:hypothetical protein